MLTKILLKILAWYLKYCHSVSVEGCFVLDKKFIHRKNWGISRNKLQPECGNSNLGKINRNHNKFELSNKVSNMTICIC